MARKQPTLRQTLYAGFTPLGPGSVGQRASAEAQLRYAPQIESLLMLLGQRRVQQRQDVQQVRRGGLAAAGGIGQVRSGLQQQLADTPAPTSEAAAHLGLTRDAVSGALAQMQAQQYAGINAGISNARRASQTDQVNILQQLGQAAQQGGLFNVSEFNALASEAHKFKAQQRQANATLMAGLAKAGLGPDGKPIPGIFNRIHPGKTPHAPVDGVDYQTYLQMTPAQRREAHRLYGAAGRNPSGPKQQTPAANTSFRTQFGTALRYAKTLHDHLTPAEITQTLTSGHPSSTVYTTEKVRNANGTVTVKRVPKLDSSGAVVKNPAIPAIKDQLAIRAAIQQAAWGGVSVATMRALRKAGYNPRALGIRQLHTGHGVRPGHVISAAL